MILSYNPIIEADKNLICAGRRPQQEDLKAIRKAQAVILPQGCQEPLYRLARANCPHVFPNLDARFDYPGKTGQIRLFRELSIPHPKTEIFKSVADFSHHPAAIAFPQVIKWNWGGQGEKVWLVRNNREQDAVLHRLKELVNTGFPEFLIQEYVETDNRTLRVVIIGNLTIVYWRIPSETQPFGSGVSRGARINHSVDPDIKHHAGTAARRLCDRTQLQLAGIDFIFDIDRLNRGHIEALILEINYYFGRTGLGGSDAFYRLLEGEVDRWLIDIGLKRKTAAHTR